MKFIKVCYENLPEKEIGYIKNIVKECENINNEPGLIITSSKNFDESLLASGLTLVVYDEDEGRNLPYGMDLVVGSFEEVTAPFLVRLWRHKNGLPCEIAVTDRTIIRELCKEDIDEIIKISRQEHILKFVEDGRAAENEQREKLLAYIEHIYKFYGFGIWGIFDKKDDNLIGAISLELLKNTKEAEYEVGFFIREEKLGFGYGKEGLIAVINYAKDNLAASKLLAITDKNNEQAVRLLEKSGFSEMNEVRKQKSFIKLLNF